MAFVDVFRGGHIGRVLYCILSFSRYFLVATISYEHIKTNQIFKILRHVFAIHLCTSYET